MATNEQLVIAALKPFESEDLTTSALRMLAFTAVNEVHAAVKRRDYAGAREATSELVRALDELEQQKGEV